MSVIGLWYAVLGLLLVAVTMAASHVRRLPVTTAILYVAAGVALAAAGLLRVSLDADATWLELVSEAAVLVSLFVAGMNLRLPIRDRRWNAPLRLALVSMTLTVGLVAWIGVAGLGLSLGAAVLLGAVLAPTDPVLASDVQVKTPDDHDPLRTGLTGEAGLNDGAAFPFVMLGLGLLGHHDLGPLGTRWLAVDVAWAVAGGLAIGWGTTTAAARGVLWLRRRHGVALGYDDLLSLGIVALAYGSAMLAHTYGFLAVFAAGLALRRLERLSTGDDRVDHLILDIRRIGAQRAATDARMGPAWLLYYARTFNATLEHIGEFGLLLVVGALAWAHGVPAEALWFVPLLFLVVRPVAVFTGLLGSRERPVHRRLMAWFGLRGIGSLYYLSYALGHGFGGAEADRVGGLVLAVVVASVAVHGVSVTPLMAWYDRHHAPEDAPESEETVQVLPSSDADEPPDEVTPESFDSPSEDAPPGASDDASDDARRA